MNTTAVLLLLVGSLFGVILMYVLTLGTIKSRIKNRLDELEDRIFELEETFEEELDSAVEEALSVLQASLAEAFKAQPSPRYPSEKEDAALLDWKL